MIRSAIASGNWSAAATFGQLSNTPTLHATTNISCTADIDFYSAVFTAPSITDNAFGAWVFNVTGSSTATVTIALQEYNGAAWSDVASVARVSNTGFKANHWYQYIFTTPYTYTTVTAGYYRLRIRSTITQNFAADGAGTAIAYLAVDNRTGVPAATDDIFIGGSGSAITVTLDGTQSIGSGTQTGIPTSYRSIGFAVLIAQDGLINADTVANSQLTCKGTCAMQGTGASASAASGGVQLGTTGTPIPAGVTCTWLFNENGVNIRHGFYSLENTLTGCIVRTNGRSLTFYKTTLSSGTGTTASPLVTADAVDWTVNDEIWVATTSGYNESEKKYIKVKNSATSYTLSNTAGGVEAGLTYAHAAGAHIVNTERNVKISSTVSTTGWFAILGSSIATYQNLQWTKFEYYGGTSVSQCFILLSGNNGTLGCDNNVFNPIEVANNAYVVMATSSVQETYSNNIFFGNSISSAHASGMLRVADVKNKTFDTFFFIHTANAGLECSGPINCTFNTVRVLGSNNKAASGLGGGFYFYSGIYSTFNNCECQASKRNGIVYNSGNSITIKWNSCLFGTIGANGAADIIYYTGTPNYFITNYFNYCSFTSSPIVSGYQSMAPGSGIFLSQPNAAAQRYEAYLATGSWQSTGAGLADTTVRTASSLASRLSPENATSGLIYEFYVLARAGKAVNAYGYLKKNAAFGTDVLRVDFFLPGSITPDDTQTMANDTAWNLFAVEGNYTGTIDTFAKVRITALSSAAGAYAYLDDIFNGTNKITAVDTWLDGEPSKIMYEQVGDAAAVWAIPTSGNVTAGSFGEKVGNKLLTLAKFLGLK